MVAAHSLQRSQDTTALSWLEIAVTERRKCRDAEKESLPK